MANKLAHAASPYLRQHSENPVEWMEWGEEALRAAKEKNLPIFLSVGYSSCHWCHVMAHESFEDPEIAEYLNRYFINIKVDREERPDIDDLYMTAVQLATGHGGWPMSVFLTPDLKPFFAGTYFAKHSRGSAPGFSQILQALRGAWEEEESDIRQKAEEFTTGLRQVLERTIPPVSGKIDVALLDSAVAALRDDFDETNGGFGGAPKFPPFSSLKFLIRYIEERGKLPGKGHEDFAAYMLMRTLEAMAMGGLRDHVGGGFHRYSTDERWHLPHFEKMLCDNGQMLWLYARAARMVDDEVLREIFLEVAEGIVDWLEEKMRIQDVYAAALDADTLGKEGQTYVWHFNEVPEMVAKIYGCEENGNFFDEATGQRTGENVLSRTSVGSRLNELNDLRKIRDIRPQPGRDDKALLAWNALVMSGLVEAGRLDLAERVATFWLSKATDYLPHQWVENFDSKPAFLDGYAYFIDALLDMEIDPKQWIDQMVNLFSDSRGFFFTGHHHEDLIGRQKPYLDQAVPSGNGVAIRVLRRCGRNEEALEHLTAAYGWAQRAPLAAGTILIECLEQLVLGRNMDVDENQVNHTIRVTLSPPELELDSDGWAYSNLTIWIPDGYHINSNDPGADWLIPTTINLEGAYGEVSFPPSESGRYEGMVEIGMRVKPMGSRRDFTASVTYQICSETECYSPSITHVDGVVDEIK